jgi:hypothetical protein
MIITFDEVETDDTMDNVTETGGHRGGEDRDGTKPMMLHDRCRQHSAASASSAGTRAPIVIVGMMPPHGGGGGVPR